MLLNLRSLTVVSLLAVFCQRSIRREVEAQTTGQVSATTFHQLILSPPTPSYAPPFTTPSSSGGLLPEGISPTSDRTTTLPLHPTGGESPGGAQPPSTQATTDGRTPRLEPPSFDSPFGGRLSGVLPLSPPPNHGQLPATPPGGPFLDVLPPSLPSTNYQPPAPPSGGLGPSVLPASLLPTKDQLPVPSSEGITQGQGVLPASLLPTVGQLPALPSTTDAVPTAPDPESFLIGNLRWKCSPEEAPTDDQIGPQWAKNIRTWIQLFSMDYNFFHEYSCSNRCGLDLRDASSWSIWSSSNCHCDKLCEKFGDCCFDFNALCKKSVNPLGSPLSSNETCLAQKNYVGGARYQGYAVWKTCPDDWTETSVRQKCQHEIEGDLLNNSPVFDSDSRITYRNIFCARCNGAINTKYWRVQFDCSTWLNTTGLNLSSIMDRLQQKCAVTKSPQRFQLKYLKKCIPRFQDCFKISRGKKTSYCQTECLRYAFPLCHKSDKTENTTRRFRNPQCALCNGFKLNELDADCRPERYPPFPPLMILFDFISTSKYSIEVMDTKQRIHQTFEKIWSCAHDEVFDPYAAKCRKLVPVGSQNAYAHYGNGTTNKTDLNPNCTFAHFNKNDYEQLTNGTIYIKPLNKIYSNTSYTVDDDGLLLCVSISARNIRKIKTTPASLHLLTAICCIVSMASLIFLLVIHILFPDLRNLPGKIIINFAFSLLLYQSVFFLSVKTSNHEQCLIVAILLHFFSLCSFTWMNVMAYDVHRVFTASNGVAANQHGGYSKRLIKYFLYAWGAPTLIVSIFVIIDQVVKKGSIGYGRGETECFILQFRAKAFSLVLPVALLMLFNIIALGHTVVHIVKTRKRTQQVTNQGHGTSITLICVKMASVMGVTWILGIVANFEAMAFLYYPYLVLNSLQGLFIFLSFAVSGRALELYRRKVLILKYPRARSGKKTRPRSQKTQEYTCPADSEEKGPTQDAHRETRL